MKREQWGSRAGFILAAVGSAIGLGNIWRFPYMAYENGGGAFFIPYLFAMITAGIPFMILEFSMGQKYRGSAPKTLSKIHPKFEWLGWFQVGVAAVIAVYYVAVIGWAISYFGMSFTQGWGEDTNAFFFSEYLQLGNNSPTNLGSIQWKIAIAMLIAWGITYAAIVGGVKSGIERASKIMMPVLFIMVIVLIGRMIFLPGALDGVNYMFEPDFSKIWDVKVWAAAYGQIFFSLSIGFAIMLAYSSYLPEKSDITNNAFMTVLINCGFSILAGIMIFSVLGYMAQEQGKPLTEVVSAGVGLAFVTLPAAINLLPAPYILGPLLFFALVVAGLSSHISIMEAVTSAIMDKLKWSRKKAANIVVGIGLVVSMAFATNGGLLLLDLVDHFANNVGIMLGGLIEIVLMAWIVSKVGEVREYVNGSSDFAIGQWFDICLRFITPAILIYILINKLSALFTDGYGGYDLTLGWVLIAALFAFGLIINATSRKEINA
ncbi:sodium-dependent transporter [Vibrio nigripulchritudo ATCC 27043]|uniref:Transporter n=2 Tax=Vibrio nigripulchritudo TaxID=28173 RepID=U4KG60_9VIBR|nr:MULTISPECIES: sodium-dependent transporter [Vibrio]EGU55896.1 sodium-dependent transporter [Vibrio nigripulchritudo ATCC 27043]UAB69330.1 sodium-dependent transporter [Vibrio sp. SCSIO 43132]CCN36683.1 putative SODIUM/CHLORIDE-DEPENDENT NORADRENALINE TRANSPORTER [Vibrio nigripulchritudo AM115]CCN42509.1 putative SODIUM/CHLORIDE-DEPENDENT NORADRENALINE TRANSPORTER [Vibrio nigripulchritudo FTn2]CCN63818.1 putative SODIUM/CHLORIDE-DEPENDENT NORADRENALINE TRANSPORTER [Vibrio nigripulchritudo PO